MESIDVCSCHCEISDLEESIRDEVSRGCQMMTNFPDYYAIEIEALLSDIVHCYSILCELSNVKINTLNQYTRNYFFVIGNRAFIQRFIKCFKDVEDMDDLLKYKDRFNCIFKYIMNGVFPNHFHPRVFQRTNYQQLLKQLERSIA